LIEKVYAVVQFVEFVGNHYILSFIWAGLLGAVVVSVLKTLFSPVKAISPQQLTQLVNRQDGVVVDIRNKSDFDKGHIAGALNVAMEQIQKKDFALLEKQQSKPIIVVCNAGMTASGVSSTLFKNGFTNVSLLQGGMNTWIGASLPVTKK
jgi:rhodanese-related sulfurtransferase